MTVTERCQKNDEQMAKVSEMCSLVYSFDYSEINLIYKKSGKAKIH